MTSVMEMVAHCGAWLELNQPPRVIVCERQGWWTVALRGYLSADVPLVETRTVASAWRLLAETPAAFVVAELCRANADALLDRLARQERDFPLVRVAVVADRSLAAWEWLVREAGAVHFTTSPREAAVLADMARRHLDQLPRPKKSLEEAIWDMLPWRRSASGQADREMAGPR